jgi:hypothetical protein
MPRPFKQVRRWFRTAMRLHPEFRAETPTLKIWARTHACHYGMTCQEPCEAWLDNKGDRGARSSLAEITFLAFPDEEKNL